MGLREGLNDEDDAVRLAAAQEAGKSGELSLVPRLLHLALHDGAEVRTMGGMAEAYDGVGPAAAGSLAALFRSVGEVDPAVREAAFDLRLDDQAVAQLLFRLGSLVAPLVLELQSHAEGRVRLRGLEAALSLGQATELGDRFLSDPFVPVRVAALAGKPSTEACLRLMREDPAEDVRRGAAQTVRFARIEATPFIEAAREERSPRVRAMLLSCLQHRGGRAGEDLARDSVPAVVEAMLPFLADEEATTRHEAAEALAHRSFPLVSTAVAACILVEPDEHVLSRLLTQRCLLNHAPELTPLLRHMSKVAPEQMHRHYAAKALESQRSPQADPLPDLEATLLTLDPATRERFHREAMRLPGELESHPDHAGGAGPSVRAGSLRRLQLLFLARFLAAGLAPFPPRRLLREMPEREEPDEPSPVANDVMNVPVVVPPGPEVPLAAAWDAFRPSSRPQVLVRVGAEVIALDRDQETAVEQGTHPSRVGLWLHCRKCGTSDGRLADGHRAEGPATYAYADDDHYGYVAYIYRAIASCLCAKCGAALSAELGFMVTTTHGGGERTTLTWDSIDSRDFA